MTQPVPEQYSFSPTLHVPNSRLPVLVYRNVLPPNPTAESTREALEKNHWMQGGVFKTFYAHHFNSVTHECYAVFKGSSRLLLGRGPLDDASEGGVEIDLRRGDIIVLPAGVSHCSLTAEDGYEYVGLYPEVRRTNSSTISTTSGSMADCIQGSPHWDNNFCKAGEEETAEKAKIARSIPVPEFDPVLGREGPLVEIWRKASADAA